jgi:iron complex transport system substrate-binding protein
MRRAIPLLLVLGGCMAPQAPGGGGIVSTNPCADAMLVELVPPRRIAAISHYSQDPAASSIPIDLAHRFRVTAGTADEVIALKPDLVVTSSFTPAASRAAYARAGLKLLLLDAPASIAASRAQVAALAEAVGATDKGRAMVARIDTAVAQAAPLPGGPRAPATLLYIGSNLVTGPGTLLDELMTKAGLRDAAGDYGLRHTGMISSERLVVRPPDLILMPDMTPRPAQRRASLLQGRSRFAAFPRTLVNCGGPTILPALRRLAAIRQGTS